MKTVNKGDTILVHYRGTLDDGSEFNSSIGKEPLEFVAGGGYMIEGFDHAVIGKTEGEKLTIRIPAAEAYGEYDENEVFTVNKSELPKNTKLEIGKIVTLTIRPGEGKMARIIEIMDEEVKLDSNHSLAGKALTFEIEILNIK